MAERTLSITLPDELADAITSRVEAGKYKSMNEAIQTALSALIHDEEGHDGRIEAIRRRVQQSLADTRPNLTGKEVRQHLDALYSRFAS